MPRIVRHAVSLLLLLTGALVGTYGGHAFATAVGLAGTGGTLTVASCRVDVSYSDRDRDAEDRRETRRCRGEFTADDGSATDPRREIVSDTAQPGDRIAVRDSGTVYQEVGAEWAITGASMVLLALALAVGGVLGLVTGQFPLLWYEHHRFYTAVHALPYGRVYVWAFIGVMAASLIGFALAEML
ncbi:hypothetical protein AB0B57_24425 [Micromonospora sp. NPDC049101]|uniref:hypothetical protein n=1 Tax=Micromonospora sp. NPDC049101 TaxID=3155032 RepID=UPI0033C8CBA5